MLRKHTTRAEQSARLKKTDTQRVPMLRAARRLSSIRGSMASGHRGGGGEQAGASAAAGGWAEGGGMDVDAGHVVMPRSTHTLLQRYLANLESDPQNPRFRKIRLANAQFSAEVWTEHTARALLGSAGWREDVEEGYLILPDSVGPGQMAHLLSQVDVTASPKGDQPVVATAGSARKRKNVDREAAAAVVDAGAAAASGDDSDMSVATRADLLPLWSSLRRSKVLPFYSDKAGANFREFSNFYSHTGFAFDIPPSVWREGYPKSVEVRFSEKAIMLCKAVLFDDREMFDQMVLSTRPAQVKQLGRGVRNFNDAVWQANLMRIAEEVVTQKFQKVPGLSEVLLRTGGNLIAEAAPRDAIWGIGLGKADPLAMDPTQWRGTNVLGWALMRARGSLGGTGVPTPRK